MSPERKYSLDEICQLIGIDEKLLAALIARASSTENTAQDLSPKQFQVLAFIEDEISRTGKPPTVREIASELGLKSPSTVQQHLDALGQKGYLTRPEPYSRGFIISNPPKKRKS